MDRNTFTLLLKRYLTGIASKKEIQVVEHWYALLEEVPRELHEEEWNLLEKRLWQKVQSSAGFSPNATGLGKFKTKQVRYVNYSIAACITLLLISSYFIFFSNGKTSGFPENGVGFEIIENKSNFDRRVTLEDGSLVILQPSAKIQFPTHFQKDQRKVSLIGEAFFQVTENPNWPFFVKAGQIITKVLGTSFIVRAPTGEANVEVEVMTGKVSVYEKINNKNSQKTKVSNGVILNPNHKVTFLADNKVFVTKIVDNPEVIISKTSSSKLLLKFEDKQIHEVLTILEQTYNIDLEVDKQSLGDCPITVNLTGKSLYPQLDLICSVIQGSYEVKGTTILISGKGCD